jgi:hypothetical protein
MAQDALVDLVFERWELSRGTNEMFIAPGGMKAAAVFEMSDRSMEKPP